MTSSNAALATSWRHRTLLKHWKKASHPKFRNCCHFYLGISTKKKILSVRWAGAILFSHERLYYLIMKIIHKNRLRHSNWVVWEWNRTRGYIYIHYQVSWSSFNEPNRSWEERVAVKTKGPIERAVLRLFPSSRFPSPQSHLSSRSPRHSPRALGENSLELRLVPILHGQRNFLKNWRIYESRGFLNYGDLGRRRIPHKTGRM